MSKAKSTQTTTNTEQKISDSEALNYLSDKVIQQQIEISAISNSLDSLFKIVEKLAGTQGLKMDYLRK